MEIYLGMENRMYILERALVLEFFVSVHLAGLLGVQDRRESYLFGNKSSNLSFDSKINLLCDIGIFCEDEKKKFHQFKPIRNKFMHALEVITFEECSNQLPGLEKYLFKNYPQDESLTKEVRLKKSVDELCQELISLRSKLERNLFEKFENEQKAKMNEEAISLIAKHLENFKS